MKKEALDSKKEFERLLRRLLELAGENPDREGLEQTPARCFRAWRKALSGYTRDPAKILARTFSEAEGYRELVVMKNIEFHSTCEHHLLPVGGVAHLAYLPGDRVVGLSKLARLVDAFASRLQLQERLTRQIATAMATHLSPRGVAVVLEGRHFCMICRGVKKSGSSCVTSCFLGDLEKEVVRAEFYRQLALP